MERLYKPGRGVRPETRTERYFSEPIELTLDVIVKALVNKHHIHTSRLKMVCTFDDPVAAERLNTIFSSLPIESKGPFFTREGPNPYRVVFNTPRILDGILDSYRKNGNIDSVLQDDHSQTHVRLEVGSRVRVRFSIRGTYSKGLLMTLHDVKGVGENEGVSYMTIRNGDFCSE
jgi:hypothetical protein